MYIQFLLTIIVSFQKEEEEEWQSFDWCWLKIQGIILVTGPETSCRQNQSPAEIWTDERRTVEEKDYGKSFKNSQTESWRV